MSHSRNEANALITKAAVGAGLPWALARDLAHAFLTLAAPSKTDWTSLTSVIAEPPSSMNCQTAQNVLEIRAAQIATAGTATIDWLATGRENKVILYDLDAPNLLAGYLISGAREYGLEFDHQTETNKTVITVAVTNTSPIPHALPRLEIPQKILETLTSFAAKTYVPESAASRLSGAGAGLNDND